MSRTEPTSGQLATAAIIAGIIVGIPCGIPQIAMLGCLFVIVGGLLGGFLLQRSTKGGITIGEGIVAGIFTGVVASIVAWVLAHFAFADAFQAMQAKALEQQPEAGREMTQKIYDLMNGPLGVVIGAVVSAIGGLVGGLIAGLIWRARKQGVE